MTAEQIEQEVTLIEAHLMGLMQKVRQLAEDLDREKKKTEFLFNKNQHLQEINFDLRKRAGLIYQ